MVVEIKRKISIVVIFFLDKLNKKRNFTSAWIAQISSTAGKTYFTLRMLMETMR